MYSFSEFMDMIDAELKQNRQNSVVSVKDEGRLAKQKEVAMWLNQSLSYLNSENKYLWRRTITHINQVETSKLILPHYWHTLDSLIKGTITYKVGLLTDLRANIYAENGNTIVMRNGVFAAGEEIILYGVFKPAKIPTNGTTEDLTAYIDIDEAYINLLKLSVLLKYAGRNNMVTNMWYGQYQDELTSFRKAMPVAEVKGRFYNKALFGATI